MIVLWFFFVLCEGLSSSLLLFLLSFFIVWLISFLLGFVVFINVLDFVGLVFFTSLCLDISPWSDL